MGHPVRCDIDRDDKGFFDFTFYDDDGLVVAGALAYLNGTEAHAHCLTLDRKKIADREHWYEDTDIEKVGN